MGENSGIQWTTHTFNPWVGCQRVSPGCVNCYAEAYDKRVGGLPKKQRKDPEVAELRCGPMAPRVRTTPANWRKPLAWDKAAAKAGERHRVFCSSLADVFEELPPTHPQRLELPMWRAELFDLIDSTKHLDWLLLTKRPENLERMLPWGRDPEESGDPWPNVWLGTTVEDQQRADERIPALLGVPAKVRFLSCEPLLERVGLRLWPQCWHWDSRFPSPEEALAAGAFAERRPQSLVRAGTHQGKIDWVIIGGESGPKARPFAVDWARDLVRQCRDAGVAPFVKQLGAIPCNGQSEYDREGGLRLWLKDPAGGDMAEWPEDLRVREFPR